MTPVLAAVRSAYAAGLSLLRAAEDGTKRPDPDLVSWREFMDRRMTPDEMRRVEFGRRAGFGMVAGPVSGYRECWDFDDAATFEAFVDAARTCGLGDVVDRLRAGYEDQTPGGGRRWIVQYPASVTFTDCTLAKRPKRPEEQRDPLDKYKTLIELPTFAVLAPSNGGTHPSGKPYVRVSGGFPTIASYTADERAELLELARSFDQMPRREPVRTTQTQNQTPDQTTDGDLRPGDDFNARAEWPDILPDWTEVYRRGDVVALRRPGKDHGSISATINALGTDRLHVFSSSTVFDADTSYSKFSAYAVLHHCGDHHAAARALYAQGYGTRAEEKTHAYQALVDRVAQRQHAAPSFAKPGVDTGAAGQCVLQPLLHRPYSGVFARAAVHLVAGSSGAGKSTLMLDLLQTQRHGGRYLGHVGAQLDYLVLFADRGAVSNTETLQRMRIDPQTMPIDYLPPTANGEEALRAILAAIERPPDLPAVVFVEGGDLLVEDASKTHVVTPFMVGLRHIAEHYSLAVVLSVGSPKARPHEQYALKRDQVFGSQAWSRLSDTVLVLTITGDGTTATRDLVVLHRNAGAETFHLAFVDGLLVEAENRRVTEPNMLEWMRDRETFRHRQFREAFGLNGTRAATILDGFVAAGTLREKEKDSRTLYLYRRDLPREKVGQSHSERDKTGGGETLVDSCPENSGTGHGIVETTSQNIECFESSASISLVPPKPRSQDPQRERNESQWDRGLDSGGIRAREEDGDKDEYAADPEVSPRRGERGEVF